jgi:hypothetical protein
MLGIKRSPWIDPARNERGAHHPNGRLSHYSQLKTHDSELRFRHWFSIDP